MSDLDVKRRSVTRDDVGTATGASIWHWMLSPQYNAPGDLPAYWSPARDWYLRDMTYQPFHDFWTGAIGIAVTKMASQGFDVDGETPILRARAQQLLLNADNNQSWVSFLGRHLQDYLCCDNGAFIEIVRATSGAGSRIIGLMHLDSLRCTRTGDSKIPALYRDTKNVEHQLKAHQILMLSDLPSSAELWFGVGLCAASRAYGAIKKLEAIERFIYEKIAGVRPKAVDLVGGVSETQLRQAVESAREDNMSRGYVQYMGAVVVPTLSDIAITHTRINFAELPDGFDYDQQFNNAVLIVANSIGLDVQDLQPLTGQPLGTATQSVVLAEKSRGKGLAAWRQQLTHMLNQFVIAPTVTFAFSENDARETQQRAETMATFANAASTLVSAQVLTPDQAKQILADEEIIPNEFVPDDTTPREVLRDSEQAVAEADAADTANETAQSGTADVVEQKEFDPNQPRDSDGKWTDAGGDAKTPQIAEGNLRVPKIEKYNDREEMIIEKISQSGHWYRIGDVTRYSDGKVFFHSVYGSKLPDDVKQFAREQKREWFPKYWASRPQYSEDWLSAGVNFSTEKSLRAEFADALARFNVAMKGGEGSGNFGHAGRPGEVGGSRPGGGGDIVGAGNRSVGPVRVIAYQGRKKKGSRITNPDGLVWASSSVEAAQTHANIVDEYYPNREPSRQHVQTMRGEIKRIEFHLENAMGVDYSETMWDRTLESRVIDRAKKTGHDGVVIYYPLGKQDYVTWDLDKVKIVK